MKHEGECGDFDTRGRCKTCRAADARAAYLRDPQKFRARSAARYESLRGLVWERKAQPCMDCGVEYPPYVMQFDHRPGEMKAGEVNDWMAAGNRSAMLAEMDRCDVVCANCHAERTYQRTQERKAG